MCMELCLFGHKKAPQSAGLNNEPDLLGVYIIASMRLRTSGWLLYAVAMAL